MSGASGHLVRQMCLHGVNFSLVAALVAWHGSKRRHMHRHKEKEERKNSFHKTIFTFFSIMGTVLHRETLISQSDWPFYHNIKNAEKKRKYVNILSNRHNCVIVGDEAKKWGYPTRLRWMINLFLNMKRQV